MLGQTRMLTLKYGNTLTTVPTRWLISGWKADDRDLHKNNKTQCFAFERQIIIYSDLSLPEQDNLQ
jgi:hypothetical protein